MSRNDQINFGTPGASDGPHNGATPRREPKLSGGVSEDELLDLVELGAESLAPGRHEVILAALKSDPKLGLLIRGMRADRAGVAELGRVLETPPTDLVERVEARLQVEALRELAQQEVQAETSVMPMSEVRVQHVGTLRLFLESAWTRRLATAASIAIVGAAGIVGVRELGRYHAKQEERLAAIGRGTQMPPGGDSNSGGETPTGDGLDVKVATNDPAGTSDGAAGLGTANPAIADATPKAPEPITLARARQLAAEGRLAISVRCADGASAGSTAMVLKRVDALSRSVAGAGGGVGGGGRESGWRSVPLQNTPAQYAMLTTPTMSLPSVAGPRGTPETTVASTTVAGTDGSVSGPGLPALPTKAGADSVIDVQARRAVVRAIYAVELDEKDRTLSTIVDQLLQARHGPGVGRPTDLASDAGVVFVELPRVLEPVLSLSPEDVLWWNTGAGAWSRPVVVPVIVETVE